MITGMEIAACQQMAVPAEVMQHVVNVESGYNQYAIGVVGGHLVRQPQNLGEAVATVQMLESKGYNFSLGLAQVNRSNLGKYGISTYQQAFDICPNVTAGARILSECYASSGNDWGKSFSCYYSGNFVTGYRDGYVQKIVDSITGETKMVADDGAAAAIPIQLVAGPSPSSLHGMANGIAPPLAPDSANYRLAIRSTVLDSAATLATNAVAAALSPASAASTPNALAATSPTALPLNSAASAAATQTQSNPVAAGASTADVFVPQVRALGEPAPVANPAMDAGSHPQQVATASTPSVDGADLRQGSRDDAFVF